MPKNYFLPPHIEIKHATFSAAQAELVTGLSQAAVRDFRRHGLLKKHTGWADYTVLDLVEMMMLKACISGGMKRGEAVNVVSDPQVLGSAVRRAAVLPGAIRDRTDEKYLKSQDGGLIAAAFELAHGATASRFLVWSEGLKPETYSKVEDVLNDRKRTPGAVIHVIDLDDIGRLVVSSAGEIACLVDRGRDA